MEYLIISLSLALGSIVYAIIARIVFLALEHTGTFLHDGRVFSSMFWPLSAVFWAFIGILFCLMYIPLSGVGLVDFVHKKIKNHNKIPKAKVV